MNVRIAACLIAAALVAGPAFGAETSPAAPKKKATTSAVPKEAGCSRNPEAAMWYSILHPGLGEWYLNGWGSMSRHAPKKKFWLGFIPLFGWPGYLQVVSAIDARHCRTNDWPH